MSRQQHADPTMGDISVCTYNILSPDLADPKMFYTAHNTWLDRDRRYDLIVHKLLLQTAALTVIALQEVPLSWVGRLTAFFDSNNYAFVVTNYGDKESGYMGVGIAFPRVYTLKDARIVVVADELNALHPPVKEQPPPARGSGWPPIDTLVAPLAKVVGGVVRYFQSFWATPPKTHAKEEQKIRERRNRLVMVCLDMGGQGNTEDHVVFATYHMPCMFFMPLVMTYHAMYSSAIVQNYARELRCPYIYMGDFNTKPNDHYFRALLGHPPLLPSNTPIPEVTIDMQSVVSIPVLGAEGEIPNVTCRVKTRSPRTGEMTEFAEMIDYILTSTTDQDRDFDAVDAEVVGLADMWNDQDSESLPNAREPSDHLVVRAVLRRRRH